MLSTVVIIVRSDKRDFKRGNVTGHIAIFVNKFVVQFDKSEIVRR